MNKKISKKNFKNTPELDAILSGLSKIERRLNSTLATVLALPFEPLNVCSAL